MMGIIKKMIELIKECSESLLKKFGDYEDAKEKEIESLNMNYKSLESNHNRLKEIYDSLTKTLGEQKGEIEALKSKMKTMYSADALKNVLKETGEAMNAIEQLTNKSVAKKVADKVVEIVIKEAEKEEVDEPMEFEPDELPLEKANEDTGTSAEETLKEVIKEIKAPEKVEPAPSGGGGGIKVSYNPNRMLGGSILGGGGVERTPDSAINVTRPTGRRRR